MRYENTKLYSFEIEHKICAVQRGGLFTAKSISEV